SVCLAFSLHDALPILSQLGFEIDAFGDRTLRVTAVPALISGDDSATALRALAEDLEGLDRGAHVQEALRRLAATMACHAAVKARSEEHTSELQSPDHL